jgi:hypothetical protein
MLSNARCGLRFIEKSLKRKIAPPGTSYLQRIWNSLGISCGKNCVAALINLKYKTDKTREVTSMMISRLPLSSARR